MPRPKRPRRTEADSDVTSERSAGSGTPQPERGRVLFSADGMIEEQPAASWAQNRDPDSEDSRSLAELAASVMGSEQFVAAEAVEDGTADPEPSVRPVQEARTRVHVTIGEPERPASRRRAGAIALLCIVLAAVGIAWLRSAADSSAPDSPGEGQLVAAPADGNPPIAGSAPPATDAPPLQEDGVIPPTAPTPEPAPAEAPAPAPAPPPAAQPAPAAAPAPAPAPPPPPPRMVHIGDLDAGPKGGKVFVQIYVHDASHKPVADVTVNLAWEGASGPASCLTGAGGSCTVHTNNLSSPATVTLTVTGASVPGGAYDAGLNHDPDGDSDGTSITVGF